MEETSIPKLLHDARASLGIMQTTAELTLMDIGIQPNAAAALTQIIKEVRIVADILTEVNNKLLQNPSL